MLSFCYKNIITPQRYGRNKINCQTFNINNLITNQIYNISKKLYSLNSIITPPLSKSFSTAFVSSHYEMSNNDIKEYLNRKNLIYTENSTHYIIKHCPFCHVIKNNTDINKLYIQKNKGIYHCFRCSVKGSWYDFKLSQGDLKGLGDSNTNNDNKNGIIFTPLSSVSYLIKKSNIKSNNKSIELINKSNTSTYNSLSIDLTTLKESISNLKICPEVTQYLHKRGFTDDTIAKYGVGTMSAKFANDDNTYKEHVCISFPFLSLPSKSEKKVERKRKSKLKLPLVETDVSIVDIDNASTSKSISVELPFDNNYPNANSDESVLNNSADSEPLFNPFNIEGIISHRVKIRSLKAKQCQRFLPSGIKTGWFGMHTVPADATTVVITEGEFDAMAVYQETGLPAISLPNGANSLPVEILPDLERFSKILLWMDDDLPGQQGSEKIARKIGFGRCIIIRSKLGKANGPKDANDALLAKADFMNIISESSVFTHSNILEFSDLKREIYRELLEPVKLKGVQSSTLPRFNQLLKGHRRGELTILTGGTGTGKTTFLSQLSLDFCKQGVRTLWGSFEIKNTRLAKIMLSQFAEKNLENSIAEFEHYSEDFSNLPLFFLKFFGSSSVEEVLDAMDYAVYANDVEHIILDNLQFMLSGQARGFDKFDMQDHAIETFRKFASQKNVHITLVIHPRKEIDGSLLGVGSVFGTAKATQEADNLLILQDTPHGRVLELKKNRFDGQLGSIYLNFNPDSRTFKQISDDELAKIQKEIKSKRNKSL